VAPTSPEPLATWTGTFAGFPGASWTAAWGVANPPTSDDADDNGSARSPDNYGEDCLYDYCVPLGGTTPTLSLSTDTSPAGNPVL